MMQFIKNLWGFGKKIKQNKPETYEDNVENYSVKQRKVLYANRSARDINNHHVRDVLKVRMPKYVPLLND